MCSGGRPGVEECTAWDIRSTGKSGHLQVLPQRWVQKSHKPDLGQQLTASKWPSKHMFLDGASNLGKSKVVSQGLRCSVQTEKCSRSRYRGRSLHPSAPTYSSFPF